MTARFVTISNTGNIAGGLKLEYRYGTWRKWKPAFDTWTGIDGSSSQGISADAGKWRFDFTAMVQRFTPAAGYAALEGTAGQQCVEEWGTSQTASKRLLKFTDVEGSNYDVLWDGAYQPAAMTGGQHGDTEWVTLQVRLRQQ